MTNNEDIPPRPIIIQMCAYLEISDRLSYMSLKDAEKDAAQRVWQKALNDDDEDKWIMADIEDMANGGIGKFFKKFNDILSQYNLSIPEYKDKHKEDNSKKYILEARDSSFIIWDEEEINKNNLSKNLYTVYYIVEIINNLMEEKNSQHSLYASLNKDSYSFYFATSLGRDNIEKFIRSNKTYSLESIPYIPTLNEPNYGHATK